jgi:hypothetical protein
MSHPVLPNIPHVDPCLRHEADRNIKQYSEQIAELQNQLQGITESYEERIGALSESLQEAEKKSRENSRDHLVDALKVAERDPTRCEQCKCISPGEPTCNCRSTVRWIQSMLDRYDEYFEEVKNNRHRYL